VNDQWRVIFQWRADGAHEVRIVDYHQEAPMNGEFAPITPGEMLKEEF
jgi:hypothetical protein